MPKPQPDVEGATRTELAQTALIQTALIQATLIQAALTQFKMTPKTGASPGSRLAQNPRDFEFDILARCLDDLDGDIIALAKGGNDLIDQNLGRARSGCHAD